MKKKVYIETTIPSFYYEDRTQPRFVAQREWTREWWDRKRHGYVLVTSVAVQREHEKGKYPFQKEKIALLSGIELLPITDRAIEVVNVYIANKVMPKNLFGDALHLSIASLQECDFLLTWNCAHLANANKFQHIRTVNERMGLFVPSIITPLELLEKGNER